MENRVNEPVWFVLTTREAFNLIEPAFSFSIPVQLLIAGVLRYSFQESFTTNQFLPQIVSLFLHHLPFIAHTDRLPSQVVKLRI